MHSFLQVFATHFWVPSRQASSSFPTSPVPGSARNALHGEVGYPLTVRRKGPSLKMSPRHLGVPASSRSGPGSLSCAWILIPLPWFLVSFWLFFNDLKKKKVKGRRGWLGRGREGESWREAGERRSYRQRGLGLEGLAQHLFPQKAGLPAALICQENKAAISQGSWHLLAVPAGQPQPSPQARQSLPCLLKSPLKPALGGGLGRWLIFLFLKLY